MSDSSDLPTYCAACGGTGHIDTYKLGVGTARSVCRRCGGRKTLTPHEARLVDDGMRYRARRIAEGIPLETAAQRENVTPAQLQDFELGNLHSAGVVIEVK